ncbi:MAG: hypothetical protein ABL936_09610 [Aestuariivirga sp.]
MDSQVAFTWVVVIAVALAVVLGAVMVSTVCRSYWKTLRIAFSAVAFAGIGALLLTTPKWTEIAFEFKELKVKVAEGEELQRQFVALKAERDGLLSKVAQYDAEKATVQTAVMKAFAVATEAKVQPYAASKWDGAASELNLALEAWGPGKIQ